MMSRMSPDRPAKELESRPEPANGDWLVPLGSEQCPQEPIPIEVALADALMIASRTFMRLGKLCLGSQKLSIPRVKVLVALAESRMRMGDHLRMRDLAEELGVTPRNITTIVDGLEREGLLMRRPDPTDRRAIWLELTSLGLSHIQQIHQLQKDISAQFFAPLDSEQRAQLAVILQAIGKDRARNLPEGANCILDQPPQA